MGLGHDSRAGDFVKRRYKLLCLPLELIDPSSGFLTYLINERKEDREFQDLLEAL